MLLQQSTPVADSNLCSEDVAQLNSQCPRMKAAEPQRRGQLRKAKSSNELFWHHVRAAIAGLIHPRHLVRILVRREHRPKAAKHRDTSPLAVRLKQLLS